MQVKSSASSRRKWYVVGVFILVLLAVILAVFLTQQHPVIPPQPNKVPSPSRYPANIDFPVSGYATPGGYGVYNPAALTNPNVGGVDINLDWQLVEPQQGVFRWAPLDSEMAAWGGAGKKLVFIVRYLEESRITNGTNCNNRQALPSWEIARVQHFCDTDSRLIIPDYFDPLFIADTKAFVKAIADHVAKSPYKNSIIYVRIGVGLAGEGMPIMSKQPDYQADINRLRSYGYSPQNWETWQEGMLSYYQSVFPWTTVIYPISNLDKNPTTGNPIQVDVAYWAAAHGFGIGAQGLIPRPDYSFADLNTIMPYVRSHWPNAYIQFQTVTSIGSYSGVQGDIATANAYGARTVEWFDTDMTNPSFQPLFQQWQQMVNSKFA